MNISAQDIALQDRLLPGVSRTFALTIPQLPSLLRVPVTNAYLLCRIADTIEDEPQLDTELKCEFNRRFAELIGDPEADARALRDDLLPLLSEGTPAAERELVAELVDVVRITHELPRPQRQALERCVATMTHGMRKFESGNGLSGLVRRLDLDRYCYYVAGVVGEMLTALFCDYSRKIERRREALMGLSVSFGQGLQMTNILKDFWEDRSRRACWLPQEVFERHGLDLSQAHLPEYKDRFEAGYLELIAMAHGHLREAMEYVQTIPREETGIRRFCLWSISLAVLTLQNIRRNPEFRSGVEVKVSRRLVKLSIAACNLLSRSNWGLRLGFRLASLGLPSPKQPQLTAA